MYGGMSCESNNYGGGKIRLTITESKSKTLGQKTKLLTGNHAAAHAIRQAKVGVISAYPITPQSPVVEKVAEFISKGKLDAKFVKVESEHSACPVPPGNLPVPGHAEPAHKAPATGPDGGAAPGSEPCP